MHEWFGYQVCYCKPEKTVIVWQTDDELDGVYVVGCDYHIQESFEWKMHMRTRSFALWRPSWYLLCDFMPYQFALGLSLRLFENRPHIRLYFGPFKLAAGGLTNGK